MGIIPFMWPRAYYKYNDGGKGRILGYQENGQDHFIVDPVDGVPGAVDQLAVGQSRSYTATYDDGTVDVFTETITGTSQVVLPSGAHDAFVSVSRLERTNPDGTFVAADITAMINPAKGLLFRHVEGRVQKPDGSVESNTFDEYVE